MAEMVKSFPTEGTDLTPARRPGAGVEGQPGDLMMGRPAPGTRQTASQVATQAKEMVTSQVTEQAGRSATDIQQVARALRQTRRDLGDNTVAPYVEKAADQLDRLSRFLRDARPAEVVRDVERFARREPLLFLGGAFALGILGARFLESSGRRGEDREWSARGQVREGRSHTDWSSPSPAWEGQGQDRSFVSAQASKAASRTPTAGSGGVK